jgi:hypothetical protein
MAESLVPETTNKVTRNFLFLSPRLLKTDFKGMLERK